LKSIKPRLINFRPRNKTTDYPVKAVITADLFFPTANKIKAEMQARRRKGK
jgi:hypothetical protein